MSKPIVVVGEVSKAAEKYYLKPSPNLTHVIEGEAPETDDENDVAGSSTSTAHEAEAENLTRQPTAGDDYIDEKLEQYWRKLGENVLMTSVRRAQPTMKIVNNMETCLDNTLATIQAASAHIRHTSMVVTQLEDSVDALLDAAKLIPSSFEDMMDVVKTV